MDRGRVIGTLLSRLLRAFYELVIFLSLALRYRIRNLENHKLLRNPVLPRYHRRLLLSHLAYPDCVTVQGSAFLECVAHLFGRFVFTGRDPGRAATMVRVRDPVAPHAQFLSCQEKQSDTDWSQDTLWWFGCTLSCFGEWLLRNRDRIYFPHLVWRAIRGTGITNGKSLAALCGFVAGLRRTVLCAVSLGPVLPRSVH